jgi:Fe-S cluster biogenesis protein NfuA
MACRGRKRVAVGARKFYLASMRVSGRSGRSQAAVEANIKAELIEVRPLIRIDHCRIELVAFSSETGLLTIMLDGSCPDCSVSPATFATAIEAHLKMKIPEIREVRIAG